MSSSAPRILFVVNWDKFFLSHRLPLGRACKQAGFDVAVCALDTGYRQAILREGFRYFPLRLQRSVASPISELRTIGDITRAYREYRPDLGHHVTIKPVIYASLVARAVGVRRIVNAVSGLGTAFIDRAEDGATEKVLRRSLWTVYRATLDGVQTRVIFQNESDRGTFVERGLVHSSRTVLIRGSGVDLTQFSPTPLPEGVPVFVLPARLLWDKGVREFVEAARLVKRRGVEARFVLLGRIDYGNPTAISEEQVKQWVQSGTIEWWGDRPHSEIPGIFRQAHVVVLPSYREGLPLSLAEASAGGRACITTDVPGCRDAVVHGETGWLVPAREVEPLADAMIEALTDRAELARRSANAAEYARAHFGLETVVSQTMAIYRELLGLPATREPSLRATDMHP